MQYTNVEKNNILKIATKISKELRGSGAKQIYVKYYEDYIEIISSGFLSKLDKFIIEQNGQSAIDTYEKWYKDLVNPVIDYFNEQLEIDIKFELKNYEVDFIKEKMTYTLIPKTQNHSIK